MPTLKLTAGKPAKRPAPKRTAAKPTAKRKPAAKASAPARKAPPKRAAKGAAKPAPPSLAEQREAQGPKLPDGWTKRDWDKMIAEWAAARADKEANQAALAESQAYVNELAMDAIESGIQMSVVHEELSLSRQRLYDLMRTPWTVNAERWPKPPAGKEDDERYHILTERQATSPHPNKGLDQNAIDARKAREAAREAKARPKAKAKAKPVAKRSPARSKPAAAPASRVRKPPARKSPASRGRVRLAA